MERCWIGGQGKTVQLTMSSSTGELRSLSDDGRQLSTEPESPPEWMVDSMLVGIDAVERGRVARNTCCSSTSVEITGTEIRKDSSKKASFVTYILTVSNASDKWKVKRRYTDFVYLHQQLKGIEFAFAADLLGAEIAKYEVRRKFQNALTEQRQKHMERSVLKAEKEAEKRKKEKKFYLPL